MKKLVIIAALFMAACHTTKTMKKSEPAVALSAEEAKGKADYEQYCSTCHGLKSPTSETPEKWHKIVPGMAARAQKKAGKVVIDEPTQQSILKYLVAMSSK
ncbi:MAG: cytochrome c [Bacteroidota bacterium]